MGGNRKGTECTDDMSSLLRMDVSDVRIKDEFTVPDESRIFEFADLFTVLPWMEMGFNPGFGVLKTSSFVFFPPHSDGNICRCTIV